MIEREKEFLLTLADKIERLATMFSEAEVKQLREIANMFTIRGGGGFKSYGPNTVERDPQYDLAITPLED